VKIGDVLADEVMNLGLLQIAPPVVELFAVLLAPLYRRSDVADRRIEPDIPVVARTVGNLKSKYGAGRETSQSCSGSQRKCPFR